jgi:hypothetical protein
MPHGGDQVFHTGSLGRNIWDEQGGMEMSVWNTRRSGLNAFGEEHKRFHRNLPDPDAIGSLSMVS